MRPSVGAFSLASSCSRWHACVHHSLLLSDLCRVWRLPLARVWNTDPFLFQVNDIQDSVIFEAMRRRWPQHRGSRRAAC